MSCACTTLNVSTIPQTVSWSQCSVARLHKTNKLTLTLPYYSTVYDCTVKDTAMLHHSRVGLSHSTISDFPTYLPAVRKASSPALSSSGCLHSRNVWSKTSLYFSTTFLAEGFTFLSLPCTKSAMMIRKTGPSRIHSIISVPIPPRGCMMAKWMEGVGQPVHILLQYSFVQNYTLVWYSQVECQSLIEIFLQFHTTLQEIAS